MVGRRDAAQSPRGAGTRSKTPKRPVLVQSCRAGDRFAVGDGPVDLQDVDAVVLGRGEEGITTDETGVRRVEVDDAWMSSAHARLIRYVPDGNSRKKASTWIEDLGSTNGVLVNGEPVKRKLLRPFDVVETGRTFWVYLEERITRAVPEEPVEFGGWSTWTPVLAEQLLALEAASSSTGHVLISGEMGTGKGFLARTLHQASNNGGPFLHLDGRERTAKQLRLDLFGGKGKSSRLLDATDGTLFIENVDALSEELQQELAQLLQAKKTADGERIRCRVVLTTASPTRKERKDRVHADLLRQMKAARVHLPTLRERRGDIGLLLDDAMARAKGAGAIERDAVRAMFLHAFSHHVKDLARVVEAAAVLAYDPDDEEGADGCIRLHHLPSTMLRPEALRAMLEELRNPGRERPETSAKPLLVQEARRPERRMPPRETPAYAVDEDDEEPTAAGALDAKEGTEERPTEERPLPSAKESSGGDVWKTQLPPSNGTDDRTEGLPSSGKGDVSSDFLDKVKDIEAFVEHFDAADVTDPAQSQLQANLKEEIKKRALQKRLDDADDMPRPQVGAVRPVRKKMQVAQRPPSSRHTIDHLERSYADAIDPDLIVSALKRSRGNVSAAARHLGKPRALLQKWMKEFGIDPADHRA